MKRILLVPLLLAGCATVPADPSKQTPEQLQAQARDRNVTVSCVSVKTVVYDIVATWMVLDKDTIRSGGVAVGADCAIQVLDAGAPQKTVF